MSTSSPDHSLVLAIDQGTTNTKAVLVTAGGTVVGVGTAPVGVTTPRPGWVEQDADRIWESVLIATRYALDSHQAAHASGPNGPPELAGIALSTQRESVVAWRSSTGEPVGPVIGWQDRRTAAWCADSIGDADRAIVQKRTGLRVDAMFSAPKLRWLLDQLPAEVPVDDVLVGTIDAWLVWRLTAGGRHVCEAGNASRTLLYDITDFDWADDLLAVFGVPRTVLPTPLASAAADFGACHGVPGIAEGTPIVAVLADSHAALYGHGCTEVGMAKATYGTGSSVMTPVAELSTDSTAVPTTLAWLVDGRPTYALEGNILSSGATLVWAAELLTGGDVVELVRLASTVDDAGGATLIPAFTGLGSPYWDRSAHALVSGLTPSTSRVQLAHAAVEAVAHQICDVVDVMEASTGPLRTFRADGGATAADLLMQLQAGLLDRPIDVADVAEVSALGAARLAWAALGHTDRWKPITAGRRFTGAQMPEETRRRHRRRWAGEVARARFRPDASDRAAATDGTTR